MARLPFLADVHVNRAYVSALRSNGYDVAWTDDGTYDPGANDVELLELARHLGLVTVTSDEDFAILGDSIEHAGIVMYHQYGHSAGAFVRAITRIDHFLTIEDFRDHVEWLENWL